MLLILASKGLAIASPWFLKAVVDGMALGTGVDLKMAFLGIGAFGATRVLSNLLSEWRMWQITKIIQAVTKKISFNAFTHLHSLEIDYHKTSSKNTVFAINRAIRSIESASRFVFGFFTPVAVEFVMLCAMLQFYCGPKYLVNMLITLSLYTYFSKAVSETRRVQMSDKKDAEKASEFYLNESIMNYEAVKSFNNEELEKSRYRKLLDKLEHCAKVVQKSLT
jgi:ABC-type transport system involved in Fe-S cluster assembly fused permease/ATPase subunit